MEVSTISKSGKDENPTAELLQISTLTRQIFERNINQHRRSSWWKHFSIFRKQLRALVSSELEIIVGGKDEAVKLKASGERRVLVWVDNYIESWHAGMMQLLSERRYAGLGVVLLTILARTCWLVGATQILMDAGREDLATKLESQSAILQEHTAKSIIVALRSTSEDLDVGEVISRKDIATEPIPIEPLDELPNAVVTPVPCKLKKGTDRDAPMKSFKGQKKMKRSKNEIENIFAAFGD